MGKIKAKKDYTQGPRLNMNDELGTPRDLPNQIPTTACSVLAKKTCRWCFGSGLITKHVMPPPNARVKKPYKQTCACGCTARNWEKMKAPERKEFYDNQIRKAMEPQPKKVDDEVTK